MFTKHTSHSTVNPLDAKQTHQELLPPRAPRGGGSHSIVPLPVVSLVWFCWTPSPLPPSARTCPELAFPGGLLLPPPRLFPLGWELWEAPVSARGGSGSVGDAGAHSLPSQMHFKAKLPFFFPFSGAGREQAGDAPVAPGGAGPSTRLCRLRPLGISRVGKPFGNPGNAHFAVRFILWALGDHTCAPAPRGAALDPPGSISSSPMGASLALRGSPGFLIPF